jgi:hypothetical protein
MKITIECDGLRWNWEVRNENGRRIEGGACDTWASAYRAVGEAMQRN